ncbi:pikachurin-like [Hydractinia symbiolongicarpus]|uniref:pikachurin-like n=1 Tax=Hydractinia symbiolongicarpus TaxID=13093 RepID=UPI00254D5CEE|nr:pikachurin-like [Hydractinia symbiolongicarpus]
MATIKFYIGFQKLSPVILRIEEEILKNIFSGHCEGDPCMNGATCNEVRDGYECICPTGYKGTDCEGIERRISFKTVNILSGTQNTQKNVFFHTLYPAIKRHVVDYYPAIENHAVN